MKDSAFDLSEMLSRGGTWHNIPGNSPSEFISAALFAMSIPGLSDRRYLAEAIIDREKASSTALGDGLSFPHPLADRMSLVNISFVAVVYPRFPILWGAPDEIPVHAAFFVVCKDRNRHLLTLSALAKKCSESVLRSALLDEAPVTDLLNLLI